ncbi:protein PET100 homolog, mitochondrial isoform 2-T2 [Hipposideros larvatus]|uniref:Protein PET100 homolog, mitochondrial isoform X2 n=1 Tax=Hipposideros armiger TaxID=186990 RepID=A0A8B7TBZ5_HIPAR|nr:PREDICTED: protein PET100 homolog, mitochondrial isoform X2 [Hipposideros armiger]
MGVKLEVFRMTLYLTFPVAMFWIANQAEWFEDHVIQRKRELWPPEREDQDEANPTWTLLVIGTVLPV